MRFPTSHRTLNGSAGVAVVAVALALGGCQTKSVSLPSNEPLVTTSPKLGNIGQNQLPAVAAATGKKEINVAANSNSWVLRHLNASKTAGDQPPIPASKADNIVPQTRIAAPGQNTRKGLRDVSLAEIPLLDPAAYDPKRIR